MPLEHDCADAEDVELELPTPKNRVIHQPLLAVGERVRVVVANATMAYKGRIGVVMATVASREPDTPRRLEVRWLDDNSTDICPDWTLERLAFKPGDRVKGAPAAPDAGRTGRIFDIEPIGYFVRWEDDGSATLCDESSLVPFVAAPAAAVFEVGDRVKIMGPVGMQGSGTVGTIVAIKQQVIDGPFVYQVKDGKGRKWRVLGTEVLRRLPSANKSASCHLVVGERVRLREGYVGAGNMAAIHGIDGGHAKVVYDNGEEADVSLSALEPALYHEGDRVRVRPGYRRAGQTATVQAVPDRTTAQVEFSDGMTEYRGVCALVPADEIPFFPGDYVRAKIGAERGRVCVVERVARYNGYLRLDLRYPDGTTARLDPDMVEAAASPAPSLTRMQALEIDW